MEISFNDNDFIVSKTDTKGVITYCNDTFIKMSGYREDELIGRPHNILRHADMPACVFKLLWNTISAGDEIFAYVKNKTKQGDFYWVFANVTPSYDTNGKLVGYYSVRRKPDISAIETIKQIYADLLRVERLHGINASIKAFEELLAKKGGHYAKFILSI